MRHLALCAAIGVLCFCGGYIYHGKTPPVIKEVEVIKTMDKIVYRDYAKVDCCDLLNKYDTAPMRIKYNVTELNPKYTRLDLTWNLYDRNGAQEIKVPVHESGNWKLYCGIGLGAVAVGGLVWLIK